MAKTYTTVPAVAAGDAILASSYNTYQKDNVNNLIVPASVRLTRGATQSIANATDTFVTWPTEVIDTDGCYTATSDTITAQTAGIYQVNTSVLFAANATGIRVISLCKNPASGADQAARFSGEAVQAVSAAGGTTLLACSAMIELAASDVVKVHVFQTSGGALNIGDTTATALTGFSMVWVGRTS